MPNTTGNKIANATKWSTITEIMAKLVTPISSMILARILAPEVFGVVASINVIISFCDLFADAGFQKYVIQHELDAEAELDHISNVAFWTNFVISLIIWVIVAAFSKSLANLVGCPGKELAVIVACANLTLHSFTSIQSARLKRSMDFKTLFYVRVITIAVPFVVTVPLAFVTKSYWSIILGTISMNASTAVAMFFLLKWIPKLEYSFKTLKTMLSFSLWSLLESILVWVINWGDTFIVSQILTQYYLGLYKTSMNMVNQILAVVSASMVPVLLSALSRVQNNDKEFKSIYYKICFLSGILLIPMGVGMFIYQDTLCNLLLGSAWAEAAVMMGIWGLISSVSILFNSYNGCVLIAKGKPKISVFVQIAQIVAIIPAVYFSANQGFVPLSYARALVRIVGMVIYCTVVWKLYGISFVHLIKMLIPTICSVTIMGAFGFFFVKMGKGMLFNIGTIIICIVIYGIMMMVFPSTRELFKEYLDLLRQKINPKKVNNNTETMDRLE